LGKEGVKTALSLPLINALRAKKRKKRGVRRGVAKLQEAKKRADRGEGVGREIEKEVLVVAGRRG